MRTLLLLLALCLSVSPSVRASSSDRDMVAVGEGVMTYMFWDVYEAKLFTPSGEYQFGQHPMRLTLTYLRDFKAKDIVKATKDQWRHLGKPEHVQAYGPVIEDLWPDIRKGDSLSYETTALGIGAFYFNGELLTEIEDSQFSDAFTAIWLSPDTSEPKLRKKLIGAGE
ncbi:chalcone isomerase family protein [Pseudoalteromonas sp. GB56]